MAGWQARLRKTQKAISQQMSQHSLSTCPHERARLRFPTAIGDVTARCCWESLVTARAILCTRTSSRTTGSTAHANDKNEQAGGTDGPGKRTINEQAGGTESPAGPLPRGRPARFQVNAEIGLVKSPQSAQSADVSSCTKPFTHARKACPRSVPAATMDSSSELASCSLHSVCEFSE